jgi:orotate phosphoribosyltransferase
MTEILMNQEEVLGVLFETGAIRKGHFKLPTGEHTNHFFQLPLALRYFNYARRLSVGLSRLLRTVPQISSLLPNVSIVGASSGGIPVAYGIREALQADQIMWVEKGEDGNTRFRQFDEVAPGENCILVDDIILTGKTMKSLVNLITKSGGKILGIGVLVNPCIAKLNFEGIPIMSLVEVPTHHFSDEKICAICKENGKPMQVGW